MKGIALLLVAVIGVVCAFEQRTPLHHLANSGSLNRQRGSAAEWDSTDIIRGSSDDTLRVTIGLKQAVGIDVIDAKVMDVSSPDSPNYGNFLTVSEIADLVAPPTSVLKDVVTWLAPHATKLQVLKTRDYIIAELPVDAVRTLFQVELAVFTHRETSAKAIRAVSVPSVPSRLADHISIVVGLIELHIPKRVGSHKTENVIPQITPVITTPNGIIPAYPQISGYFIGKNNITLEFIIACVDFVYTTNLTHPCIEQPPLFTGFTVNFVDQFNKTIERSVDYKDLLCKIGQSGTRNNIQCNITVEGTHEYYSYTFTAYEQFGADNTSHPRTGGPLIAEPQIWPNTLRQQYNVPAATNRSNPANIISIASFGGESYSQSDLQTFCAEAGIPFNQPERVENNEGYGTSEGTLDLQTVVGNTNGARIWYIGQKGSNSFILEWAQEFIQIGEAGPLVHTISYGLDEQNVDPDFGTQYREQAEVELAKLALLGKTIVIASGDQGSPGRDDSCAPLHATWPGCSPYVLSVGATRNSIGKYPECWPDHPNNTASAADKCEEVGEIITAANFGCFWTTGGGFSGITAAIPSYQAAVVKEYLSNKKVPIPPYSVFNSTGRAYPDISAIGHNYAIIQGGRTQLIDGTSASTPFIASIITQLNDLRLNKGLKPFGFINPWIYQVGVKYPTAFNDIITGNTKCMMPGRCCPNGFYAAAGWDPASGFGTPNFPELAKLAVQASL